MARIPFWLYEPVKRFLLYLGVLIASIPAGVVYLFLLKILPQTIALVVTLPFGMLAAYFVWQFLDKRIILSRSVSHVLAFDVAALRTSQTGPLNRQTAGTLVNVTPSGLAVNGTLVAIIIICVGAQPAMTLDHDASSQVAATGNTFIPIGSIHVSP